MKTTDFSETIEACDLKVGRCRQLIAELTAHDQFKKSFTFRSTDDLLSGERLLPFWLLVTNTHCFEFQCHFLVAYAACISIV